MKIQITRPQLTVGELAPRGTYQVDGREVRLAQFKPGNGAGGRVVIEAGHRLLVDISTGELLWLPNNQPVRERAAKELPFSHVTLGPFLFRGQLFVRLNREAESNAVCVADGSSSTFLAYHQVELLSKLQITTL